MIKALAVVLVMSGCSVALQSKPTRTTTASRDCSTSHLYWGLDAAGAAVGMTALGVGVATEQDGYLMAGVGAVAAVIYLASAHNGYKWRSECAAPSGAVAAR